MVPIEQLTGRLGNKMFQYAFLYAQTKKGEIADIYLQDPKYFKNCTEEVKQLFGSGIGSLPYVSIHVRRGDYVGNKFYVDLTETGYYTEAIAMFPGKEFLVFSDDIEFCKNIFPEKEFQFSEGNDEITDLNSMASCEHNIISNSSFSWWASFLNPNPNKKVVAPSVNNWYSDQVERTKCPKEWIRI